jgi:hypothetical protein
MTRDHDRRFHILVACFGICAIVANAGCHRARPPAQATPVATRSSASKLSKIVFVGKERACECTRKAVDAGWAALHKVLVDPGQVLIERIHVDSESARVEPYRAQKPIMALPAIYFVDGRGAVLEMLQGEVGEAQIQAVVERTR